MKQAAQIQKELDALNDDLRHWRRQYDKVDMNRPDGASRRLVVGNTISGVQAQIEALKWVLEEN